MTKALTAEHKSATVQRPLREKRKLMSRQAILDAALYLFSMQGYNNTSLQEIAAQAGLHEQTLYRHFASKTELANGISDMELEKFREFFNDRNANTLQTWREWVKRRAKAHSAQKSSSFFAANPSGSSIYLGFQFRYERILADGLAKDMAVDLNKDPRPMLIACMLWGSNLHASSGWVKSGAKGSLVTTATDVVDNIGLLFPELVGGSIS